MESATEKAYQFIRKAILDGDLEGGSPIKEQVLSELCGLSRTPIRSALSKLANEGLVTVKSNHRTYVTDRSETMLNQAYDLAKMLEGYSAALAAQYITKSELADLEALTKKMDYLRLESSKGRQTFLELNTDFHNLIHKASRNPYLYQMIQNLPDVANSSINIGIEKISEAFNKAKLEHHQILKALQSHNMEKARFYMQAHVDSNRRSMLAMICDSEPHQHHHQPE